MKKRIGWALLLALVSSMAAAQVGFDQDQGFGLKEEGRYIEYKKSAKQNSDGSYMIERASVFVGTRWVRDLHGQCWRVVLRLEGMRVKRSGLGISVEDPDIKSDRTIVRCDSVVS